MNGISVPRNNRSASNSQPSHDETAGGRAADAFAKFAEDQISAPRKRAIRAAERRTLKRTERAKAEKSELLGIWGDWQKQRKQALLEGPHKEAACQLIGVLERLTPEHGNELIACARAFQSADADTRATVLALCDGAIVRMREANDLPLFDDPFLGEPNSVFLILRGVLS